VPASLTEWRIADHRRAELGTSSCDVWSEADPSSCPDQMGVANQLLWVPLGQVVLQSAVEECEAPADSPHQDAFVGVHQEREQVRWQHSGVLQAEVGGAIA